MKIAICALVKNENLYLREWVEYHKSIGFDNVIIYDNNENRGEYPHQVIFDYIQQGYVIVHNIRGQKHTGDIFSAGVMNDALKKHHNDFDWIAFIDVDEFFELETNNIHCTFSQHDYSQFDGIVISWKCIGDGQLYYKEGKVQDRFHKEILNNFTYQSGLDNSWMKTIANTKTKKHFNSPHSLFKAKLCVAWGGPIEDSEQIGYNVFLTEPIHHTMYLRHYPIKSFQEFLCRRKLFGLDDSMLIQRLSDYKKLIGWSDEHQKMLENIIEYTNNTEKIKMPKIICK